MFCLLHSCSTANILTSGTRKFFTDDRLAGEEIPVDTEDSNVNAINSQQVINITEAAIIHYFEPPYNVHYKDVFPNPAQKTYKYSHSLNIYSVGIELDTYGVANCHIFSQKVEPKWLHMKTFVFHSEQERKELFELLHSGTEV